MSNIVLASGSPRRQELLNRIGITDFDIRVPETDEHYPAGLSPAQIVEYISREKADAATKLCTPEEIVITADTMVFLDDQRLGKPRDEADALRMLTELQGRGLRRAGQGRSAGGTAGGRLFQRHGAACPAAEPDAGSVWRKVAVNDYV